MLSQSMENYLKAIYELQQESDWVSTSALARRLGHAPASATNMIKKLAAPDLNLLQYVPYRGTRLTTVGEKIALEVIRHHRLIELYLAEVMGVPWDKVHDEAERIEHVISEDLEERMAKALGHPTIDPHGSPIPSKSGHMLERNLFSLVELELDRAAVVAEVYDENPELLRYLGELGLYPGTTVTLVEREPFGGSLKLLRHDTDTICSVSEEVARLISVTPLP